MSNYMFSDSSYKYQEQLRKAQEQNNMRIKYDQKLER